MRTHLLVGSAWVVLTGLSLPVAQAAAQAPRTNPVITLLEQGKPVFSIWGNYVGVGNDYEAAVTLQNNENYDFIIYDLEHHPLDVVGLSQFLRALLDPALIAAKGVRATKPVIVRIPPNGREIHYNQWMIKQILDTGVAGLMLPHIETAEQALAAVQAVRFPQPANAPNVEPEGLRGWSPSIAVRYWGLSSREYERHSDVWGLQPDAEMLLLLIIESKLGVENVRDIARALKAANVKAVLWAGSGDMSISYHDEELLRAGIDRVIAAGREFGFPVGVNGTGDFSERYAQGARVFFDLGVVRAASGPTITPEERAAVGR